MFLKGKNLVVRHNTNAISIHMRALNDQTSKIWCATYL